MNAIDIVAKCLTLIVILGPLVVQVIKYIGIKTGNAQVALIADRANIIVTALERTDIANANKKTKAIEALLHFANNDMSITLSPFQAEQYIESAVTTLRRLNGEGNDKAS